MHGLIAVNNIEGIEKRMSLIGTSVPRKEAADKVTGKVKYTDDSNRKDILYAWMLTSIYAHANIKKIDLKDASELSGVRAIITGEASSEICGPMLEDRPILAKDKVRYYGEPIAVVIADSEQEAKAASKKIIVEYEPLPVVNSPTDAIKEDAPIIHENIAQYKIGNQKIYPEAGTNIANRTRIRKGDMQKGWSESVVIVEQSYSFPQSDHVAMENRTVKAEIKPDGQVIICSSSQEPTSIKNVISKYFHIEEGKIVVITPLVGGGFGGKALVQLELIAVLASQAVKGRLVRVANTREQDMVSSPVHIGFDGKVKLGANAEGKIVAAELLYLYDCGAYTDSGPLMSRAAAVSCTGPYNIENVWCDSLCVYTNHPYVTAFRGFGHGEFTTAIERTMDILAFKLGISPLDLRMKNAIAAGNTSPTRVKLTPSNAGNLAECIKRVAELVNWNEGQRIETGNNKVRAKGLSCFWKTSSSPTDASSGVILTLNSDGTVNLNCGVIEYGNAAKTTLAQILAEKLKMDVNQIHVQMEVNTMTSPSHWKTVASMSTYMAGNAVIDAANDLIKQIIKTAAVAMRCRPDDLQLENGKVYFKPNREIFTELKDIVHGYKYPNGNAVGGQIISSGSFTMRHLTDLNKETGEGSPGPYWTTGAQAVEIEYDKKNHSYKFLKAVSVIDAGKLINPMAARGIVIGGMCMGLGLASSEGYLFDNQARVLNTSLRTYKPLHIGEVPEYVVNFIEIPLLDSPYGARGFGEHGILGMPGAVLNSLSSAAQVDLNKIPVTPEVIWRAKGGTVQ